MFHRLFFHLRIYRQILLHIALLGAAYLLVSLAASRPTTRAQAQAYEKELTTGKSLLTIKNRNGRVSVVTSDDEKSKASLQATSSGAPVEPADVSVSGSEISVRERRDRIDLTVHVPKRAREEVGTATGMVDVIGDREVPHLL